MASILIVGKSRRETGPGFYRIEEDGTTRVYHQLFSESPEKPQDAPRRVFKGVFDGLCAKPFLIRPRKPHGIPRRP